jgi:hypothetical protein
LAAFFFALGLMMHPSWFSREVVYRGLVNSASKRRLGLKQEGAGRSPDWLKMKNPEAPAVKREVEENFRLDCAARLQLQSLARYFFTSGMFANSFSTASKPL